MFDIIQWIFLVLLLLSFLLGLKLYIRMIILKRLVAGFNGPNMHWALGNFNELINSPQTEIFKKFQSIYGDTFRFIGITAEIVCCSAEIVKQIFDENERGRNLLYPLVEAADADGLFTLPYGQKWKLHRQLLAPLFNNTSFRLISHIVAEKTEIMAKYWEETASAGWTTINAVTEFQNLTLDIIGRAGFGYEFQAIGKTKNEVVEAFEYLLAESTRRIKLGFIPYWRWLPVPSNFKLKRARHTIKTKIAKILAEKEVSTEKHSSTDLLDLLLASLSVEHESFTKQDIYSECITFVAAGYETTALSLTFLFHLLGSHPAIQEKLREKIRLLDNDSFLTCLDIELVIKESLRMYPVVYINRREVSSEKHLGKGFIQKGCSLVYSTYNLHHDNRYWSDPDLFIPERFLGNIVPGSYVPFGGGERSCIGKNLAINQMKLTLGILLKKFIFQTQTKMEVEEGFVLKPKGSCLIQIKKKKFAN